MNRIKYLLLTLAVGILAIIYFITRPAEMADSTYSLPKQEITIDPRTIVKIELERSDSFVRIEQIKGVWKISEPVHSSADEDMVDQFLENASKFRLAGMVSTNPEKQSVFQVDEQGTKVVLTNEDGSRFSIMVGKASQNAGQAYVRPLPGDTVYLAQGLTPDVVNRDLRDWRERTVYRTDPELINLITVRRGGDKVVLQRGKRGWSANGSPVAPQVVKSTLHALAYIRAEDFIDTAVIISSPPAVQVDFVENGLVRMDFFDPGARSEHYILKSSNSPNVYAVSKSTAQGLIRMVEQLSPKPEPTRIQQSEPSPVASTPPPAVSTPRRQQEAQKPSQPSTAGSTPARTEVEGEGVLTVHTVKYGETLESIAQRYGTTPNQIKAWNLMTRETVSPGMELYVFVRK